MPILKKLPYYRRILRAYLLPGVSQISFWHDSAEINPRASANLLGEYYMNFPEKAAYAGPKDSDGTPLLNYHGDIGLQYNPIAIAQWGLGNFNIYRQGNDLEARSRFLAASNWLCRNLEPNAYGIHVWNHVFDWEYRETLRAPWYSGLAQGQGISLLVRAHSETGEPRYLEAARLAFRSFARSTHEGGVTFTDRNGDIWFEEYLVFPPTHILNGFIWAAWGVYDYGLWTGDAAAGALFLRAAQTIVTNLDAYDLGFWSLYEQSGTRLPMIASPFYHRLHVAQLRVMHRITGEETFARYAERWALYSCSRAKRARALCYKGAFKLCYY